MFRRKSVSKGAKERGSARAKKAVKRLLERPTPERIAEIAELASRENLQPFRVRGRGSSLEVGIFMGNLGLSIVFFS